MNKPRYQVDHAYSLRLPVCDDCYQAGYLLRPESYTRDDTPLGRSARLDASLYTLGGVIAATGILLMTDIVPDSGIFLTIASWWRIIVAAGVLVLFAAWLHQRWQQKQVLAALTSGNIEPAQLVHNEVRTPILDKDIDPASIPLEIRPAHPGWAAECATRRGWTTREDTTMNFKGEE